MNPAQLAQHLVATALRLIANLVEENDGDDHPIHIHVEHMHVTAPEPVEQAKVGKFALPWKKTA